VPADSVGVIKGSPFRCLPFVYCQLRVGGVHESRFAADSVYGVQQSLPYFPSVAAAIVFFSHAASAQTVDEAIGKNIQAHGGVDKLKARAQYPHRSKVQPSSFRAEFRKENKRADKVRVEFIIQGLALVQAYDGKTGWQISPFGGRKDPELLSQDDLKAWFVDADIDGPLVGYKEKGHKAELVGTTRSKERIVSKSS